MVGIIIIVRNSYNISDCNQNPSAAIFYHKNPCFLGEFAVESRRRLCLLRPCPTTWSGKAYIDAITLIAIIKQAAIASIIRQ
jgi:hypothetical protein